MLWFILIVNVCSLSVSGLIVHFTYDSLVAISWERAVTFDLCCFNFSAMLVVHVPFPKTKQIILLFWAGCGIRLYRFLIIPFYLLCVVPI